MAGHGYPPWPAGMSAMEVGCRRWQAMATREPNSALQLTHLNPSACGAFELTAWLLWWAGLIMLVANKLSAPGLWIYCGCSVATHFSPAKWWKQNTTNEATIVLHIKRDASVAYLCVRHIRFGILREKPYCICQKFMSNGNKMKNTIVNLKQNYMSQDRTSPNASACKMAKRHNAHNVTAGFLLNWFGWLLFLLTFRVKNPRGTMSSTRSKKPSQTGWTRMW